MSEMKQKKSKKSWRRQFTEEELENYVPGSGILQAEDWSKVKVLKGRQLVGSKGLTIPQCGFMSKVLKVFRELHYVIMSEHTPQLGCSAWEHYTYCGMPMCTSIMSWVSRSPSEWKLDQVVSTAEWWDPVTGFHPKLDFTARQWLRCRRRLKRDPAHREAFYVRATNGTNWRMTFDEDTAIGYYARQAVRDIMDPPDRVETPLREKRCYCIDDL